MRKLINKHPQGLAVFVLACFAVAFVCFVAAPTVKADYRPGASTILNSTFTGANANVGLHTPVVTVQTGAMSAITNQLFTSGTAAISFDSSALITTAFDLSAVYVTYSAASSTQTLIMKRVSSAGVEFRNTFFTDAADTTATIFRPARPMPFASGDALTIEYGNVNSDTVGVEVEYTTP